MLRATRGMIIRDLCKMFNIFYNHWSKRDGAIYKDLAFMGHNERINMLENFKKNQLDMNKRILKDKKLLKQYGSLIQANLRGVRYYNKLISYIRKNPNIPIHKGFKSYAHYLTNNDEKKIKKLKGFVQDA